MPKMLDELEELLRQAGDDPIRLDIVQRAQRFKRSWVELAEGLDRLRSNRAYEGWGYSDLQEYCQKELQLRPATVDKLTLSFSAMKKHAPEVLARDGVAKSLPSQEAAHYFAKAVEEPEEGSNRKARLDAPPDVVEQLRSAVFDEGTGVTELRRRFDPVLRPKPEATEKREAIQRTRAAGRKLMEAARQVEGLTEKRIARLEAAVDAVMRDLDAMEPKKKADQAQPEEATA